MRDNEIQFDKQTQIGRVPIQSQTLEILDNTNGDATILERLPFEQVTQD